MKGVKRTLICCTTVRIILLLCSSIYQPIELSKYTESPAVKSVIADPVYTLDHLREGYFLSRLAPTNDGLYYLGNDSTSRNHAHVWDETSSSFFYASPIVLAAFDPLLTWVKHPIHQDFIFSMLMLIVDFITAVQLYKLAQNVLNIVGGNIDSIDEWEKRLEQEMSPLIQPTKAWMFGIEFANTPSRQDKLLDVSDIPTVCAVFYYCNPISILASCTGSLSLHGVFHLLLISAFEKLTTPIVEGNKHDRGSNISLAILYIALLSHLEVSYICLMPAAIIINQRSNSDSMKRASIACITLFVLWSCVILIISVALVGTDNILRTFTQSHKKEFNFTDLEPNLGLHWYFFINMFDRFRQYFAVMHSGLIYLFPFPLVMRFHRYPIAMVALVIGIQNILKASPTVNDLVLLLPLLLMSPRSLARTGNLSLVPLVALFVPISLFVMDHWLWLETGVGNANYLFFQCVACNVFLCAIVCDFAKSTMARDKALRLTEKSLEQN